MKIHGSIHAFAKRNHIDIFTTGMHHRRNVLRGYYMKAAGIALSAFLSLSVVFVVRADEPKDSTSGVTQHPAQNPTKHSAQVPAQNLSTDSQTDPASNQSAREAVRYETDNRAIGTPIDVDQDLQNSFRQPGAVFTIIEAPAQSLARGKKWLYDKVGLQLGLSYQMQFQSVSGVLNDAPNSTMLGWLLFEGRWELIDRKGDFKGSFVGALDWRHIIGDTVGTPEVFRNMGSLWLADTVAIPWDPYATSLFWEQWLKKNFLVVRIGQQNAPNIYDFFRFKDPRVSFTGSPYANNPQIIPGPPPGFGASFEMWPIRKPDSELYVVGTLNDMNAPIGKWDWSSLGKAQFFYGLEVGYNWKRAPNDFDHVHLDLFYADKRDTAPPNFPNKEGWGLKARGTKQWGNFVLSGSYSYTTAQGGALGFTLARHEVSTTVALVTPLNVNGEIALGAAWTMPNRDIPFLSTARDQYGLETYWRILLTPNLWVTPGVQAIINPSLNPERDMIGIGQVKFRLVL